MIFPFRVPDFCPKNFFKYQSISVLGILFAFYCKNEQKGILMSSLTYGPHEIGTRPVGSVEFRFGKNPEIKLYNPELQKNNLEINGSINGRTFEIQLMHQARCVHALGIKPQKESCFLIYLETADRKFSLKVDECNKITQYVKPIVKQDAMLPISINYDVPARKWTRLELFKGSL